MPPFFSLQPRTLVIDTWEAFDDDMTFNLGGEACRTRRRSFELETLRGGAVARGGGAKSGSGLFMPKKMHQQCDAVV